MKATTIEKTGKQAKGGCLFGCLLQVAAAMLVTQSADVELVRGMFLGGFLIMVFSFVVGWWEHG